MKCRYPTESVLLVVFYLLSLQLLDISSHNSSVKFLIRRNCTVFLELATRRKFLVTFFNCRERQRLKSEAEFEGNVTEGTSRMASSSYSKLSYRQADLDSTERFENVTDLFICSPSYIDAEIKGDSNQEWIKLLSSVHEMKEPLCLHRLVGLFRTLQTLCHILHYEIQDDILCQLPVKHIGARCLQLSPCKRYQTNRSLPLLCTCKFHPKKREIRHEMPLPSLRPTSESSSFRAKQAHQSRRLPGDHSVPIRAADVNKNLTDKVICSHSLPNQNCTHWRSHRSTESAQCPLGYYGTRCSRPCHCKNKSPCDPVSGTCVSLTCELGWQGQSCSKRACPPGHYGIIGEEKCNRQCSCRNPEDCDVLSGECQNELCWNRSVITDCLVQLCPRRYTGYPTCGKRCFCSHDMVCNPVTGDCPGKLCKRDYEPPGCINYREMNVKSSDFVLVFTQFFVVAVKFGVAVHLRLEPLFL